LSSAISECPDYYKEHGRAKGIAASLKDRISRSSKVISPQPQSSQLPAFFVEAFAPHNLRVFAVLLTKIVSVSFRLLRALCDSSASPLFVDLRVTDWEELKNA